MNLLDWIRSKKMYVPDMIISEEGILIKIDSNLATLVYIRDKGGKAKRVVKSQRNGRWGRDVWYVQ